MENVSRTFERCGAIDCGANHREGNKRFRVSIRKNGPRYAVQRHVFFPQKGEVEVEYSGSLRDCIAHVKQSYGYEDKFSEKLGGEKT